MDTEERKIPREEADERHHRNDDVGVCEETSATHFDSESHHSSHAHHHHSHSHHHHSHSHHGSRRHRKVKRWFKNLFSRQSNRNSGRRLGNDKLSAEKVAAVCFLFLLCCSIVLLNFAPWEHVNDDGGGSGNSQIKDPFLNVNNEYSVTIPTYWKEMIDKKTQTVKTLQTAGGKDCVSFVWASDTHIPDNHTAKTDNLGRLMAKMLDNCEIPFALLTGDIGTRASHAEEAALIAAQEKIPQHLAPLWGTDRLLVALGNHDGCWGDATGYYKHQLNPDQMWQMYFRNQALDFRRVFSDDGMYYYIDNAAQKTRFIVLNSHFAGEYAEDENGWAVNDRFATSCYGQEQLDWLADVALDMPDGYSAVLSAHVPPNIEYTVDKQQLIGIVNAYCNKTAFSGSYTGGVDGWSNSTVNVDFTDAKGEIIAMFAGHVHGDAIDVTTMACPIITILSSGAAANEPYAENAPERVAGTDTETSFDVVTINKRTRTIYLTRVGAGEDRVITY